MSNARCAMRDGESGRGGRPARRCSASSPARCRSRSTRTGRLVPHDGRRVARADLRSTCERFAQYVTARRTEGWGVRERCAKLPARRAATGEADGLEGVGLGTTWKRAPGKPHEARASLTPGPRNLKVRRTLRLWQQPSGPGPRARSWQASHPASRPGRSARSSCRR